MGGGGPSLVCVGPGTGRVFGSSLRRRGACGKKGAGRQRLARRDEPTGTAVATRLRRRAVHRRGPAERERPGPRPSSAPGISSGAPRPPCSAASWLQKSGRGPPSHSVGPRGNRRRHRRTYVLPLHNFSWDRRVLLEAFWLQDLPPRPLLFPCEDSGDECYAHHERPLGLSNHASAACLRCTRYWHE